MPTCGSRLTGGSRFRSPTREWASKLRVIFAASTRTAIRSSAVESPVAGTTRQLRRHPEAAEFSWRRAGEHGAGSDGDSFNTSPMETPRNRLDGLRGLAALIVFAIHVWIYQLPNTVELRRDSWEKTLLFEGRVAFVMFFVLSGYLLYRAFARAALGEQRAGRRAQLPGAPRGADRARLLRRAGRDARRCSRPRATCPGRRARGRRRAAAVLRVRAELLARHAAEAERRDLDAGGRGRLLSAAAA